MELLYLNSSQIDPTNYFFNSEDYFTKLMFLKPLMNTMVKDRHFLNRKKFDKVVKIRKCIR